LNTEDILLGDAMRKAWGKTLSRGWLYLPTSDHREFSSELPCLLVLAGYQDEGGEYIDDTPKIALDRGFPIEGLDDGSLEQVASWVGQFEDAPSVDLLVESFTWYWKFDGFLPQPGAPIREPTPQDWEETYLRLDREFYDTLGEDRPGTRCRRDGCARGAIEFSVLCKSHHFESYRNRPCPFED